MMDQVIIYHIPVETLTSLNSKTMFLSVAMRPSIQPTPTKIFSLFSIVEFYKYAAMNIVIDTCRYSGL